MVSRARDCAVYERMTSRGESIGGKPNSVTRPGSPNTTMRAIPVAVTSSTAARLPQCAANLSLWARSGLGFMHKLRFGGEPVTDPCRRIGVDPFVGTEALAAGAVNRYQLATRYDAIYRNIYVPSGHQLTPVQKAIAAWLWSRRQATVAGVSAAALHGSLWIDARLPAELNQPSQHMTKGIVLHSDALRADEIVAVRDIPVTTPARTAFDLGRRYGLTLAVIRLDAMMQATAVKPAEIEALIHRHPGMRGVVQLRGAISLADGGAESPQETRTRLVLTEAGLRPERTQIEVYNDYGDFVGRIDMGWPGWRVGVEYDGVQHWTDPERRARDIDRQAELEALGWRIVRVSADMLRYTKHVIVERTRTELRAAGADV